MITFYDAVYDHMITVVDTINILFTCVILYVKKYTNKYFLELTGLLPIKKSDDGIVYLTLAIATTQLPFW